MTTPDKPMQGLAEFLRALPQRDDTSFLRWANEVDAATPASAAEADDDGTFHGRTGVLQKPMPVAPFGWLWEGPQGLRQFAKMSDTMKPVLDLYTRMAERNPEYKITYLFTAPPKVGISASEAVPYNCAIAGPGIAACPYSCGASQCRAADAATPASAAEAVPVAYAAPWTIESLRKLSPTGMCSPSLTKTPNEDYFTSVPLFTAPPKVGISASEEAPCPYCDDTGDVHTQTGEWRGRCTCPAGAMPDLSLKDETVSFLLACAAPDSAATPPPAPQPAGVPDVETVMRATVRRVVHELNTYNPAADEYKGKYIHGVWARELTAALASLPEQPHVYRDIFGNPAPDALQSVLRELDNKP